MEFLHVENLHKKYGKQTVLNGINFQLRKGDQCVIQGASGSGKSTLLYLIGGLENCEGGDVIIDGEKLFTLSDEKLAQFRNSTIGFVFQFHFLLPSMNCLENIFLPAKIGGKYSSAVKERALTLAQILGVEQILFKFPYQISGGEQQRINIIRALSLRPKLLLCDEPTGNLDSKNSELVTQLLSKLAKEFEATLVLVTHDQQVAAHFPRKIHMQDGQLIYN